MTNRKDYPIHIRLDAEQLARLDAFCAAAKMSRSQVVRELLGSATIRPAVIRSETPEIKESVHATEN